MTASRPLRIAYLVWRFPVSSESFVVNEVCGAAERGHDVTVLALSQPADAPTRNEDVDRMGLAGRILPLALSGGLAGVLTLGRVAWCGRAMLPRVARLADMRRFGRAGFKAKLLHQGIRLAELPPFDVLHCQFGTLGLLGWRLRACGLLSGRLVATFRGYDASRFVREHGPEVYRGLFADGDHFLTNCAFFRDKLVGLGCDPARLSVQRSGIDTERFAFTPRRMPESGDVVIATVGRLVEKKGVADCLRAIAETARTHPRVAYRIVGDGPLRNGLEALARELGVGDRVTFLGAGDQRKVIETLDAAHLFLAPSVTAADGDQDAPINVLKEAMAMGLPVISTVHGGIPELVVDGASGRLVPERDPAALAAAIRELLARAQDWPRIGAVGRARVEAEYDKNRLNDQLDRLYRRLAGQGRGAGKPLLTAGAA